MLQRDNTDLFNPLVPKAHNSECQNIQFPLHIKTFKSQLNSAQVPSSRLTFNLNPLVPRVQRIKICKLALTYLLLTDLISK